MKKLLCFIILMLTTVSVFADRGIAITVKTNRLALVIGNGAYKVGPLKNRVMAETDCLLAN